MTNFLWKLCQRTAASLTLAAFGFSALVPAEVRAAQVESALRRGAAHYEKARGDFANHGPAKFAEAMELTKQDRAYVVKAMQGFPELPKLRVVSDDELRFEVNGKIYVFAVVDAAKGQFRGNGRDFRYDLSRSLEWNVEKIQGILATKTGSWWNPISEAHAVAVWMVAAGALMMGLLGFWVGKRWADTRDEREDRRAEREEARERKEWEREDRYFREQEERRQRWLDGQARFGQGDDHGGSGAPPGAAPGGNIPEVDPNGSK